MKRAKQAHLNPQPSSSHLYELTWDLSATIKLALSLVQSPKTGRNTKAGSMRLAQKPFILTDVPIGTPKGVPHFLKKYSYLVWVFCLHCTSAHCVHD